MTESEEGPALMRLLLLAVALILTPVAAPAAEQVQFSILFGVGDEEPAAWNGSIRASGARVLSMEVWRPEPEDRIDGTSWQVSSRRVGLTRGAAAQERQQPVLENGVFVQAEMLDSAARFEVTTDHGDFSFSAVDLKWGETLDFLNRRVCVERIPVTRRLSTSPEEQDFPALAKAGDKAYLAFVEFTHGERERKLSRQLEEKPDSFETLRRPAGGDRVWLRELDRSSGTWGEPQPVTPTGQDVYGVATAVDGNGRVWVIWSAQVDGNFDLYARFLRGGRWSMPRRVTKAPGPDLSPAAVTDSEGRVWVVWQGYRESFDVLAVRQRGERFTDEQRVSVSGASDWAPQIAAGPRGEVAVVWDTYDKGDYDVYLRRLRFRRGIRMDSPLPVAASNRFEARATAVYDTKGAVWVGWEESYPAWGKDFGAYETSGTGLYQGSTVRVRVLEGGKYFRTAESLEAALERRPASHPMNRLGDPQGSNHGYTPQPAPALAGNRRSGTTPYERSYPSRSYPRLAASEDGAIFLTYRSAAGRIWGSLGTCWFANVVWFDGASWQGPAFVAHTDGVLDNRPALLGLNEGSLLMVAASDRRFIESGLPRRAGNGDRFDYDLFAHEMKLQSTPSEYALRELPPERPAVRPLGVGDEERQVGLMRDYRVQLDTAGGSEKLQLLRGEFHRHTSISGDGGNDGDIIDAWRYFIDAASMDWAGCCDHDNGNGREYTWWLTQKMTDAFLLGRDFVPMFSYERSVRYPEGHRNVIFAQRGVRALPRLPKTADDSPADPAPDTLMLYEYLRFFDGIAAVHTSGTNMGTDWRDNDPEVEPVVEIYQGDRQNYEIPGGPRTNTEEDSIGGWRPLGFVSKALAKGYRLGFQASSDHISTHMSYCNVWVPEPTREAILDAFKKRRVYGATDNILADVRCSGHFMGEEFTLDSTPRIDVKLTGTDSFAKVHVVKDNKYVYTAEPGTREVEFSWRDSDFERGKTSYYYVRGEQADGEIVWVSPMWIEVR